MEKILAMLILAAVLSAVLISGCTQQTINPIPQGTPDKATEDKTAAALESELDQALENMTDADIENALLNQ